MQNWFVHIQGETLGPLTTKVVTSMLQTNRIQFADYIWKSGMTQWKRISELDDFIRLLPSYPEVSVPSEEETASAPVPAPAPQRVQETVPIPQKVSKPEKREEKKPEKKEFPKVRRYDRVPIEAKITADEHGIFQVLDIGEGGVFVKAKTQLPVGTEMRFKLESSAFPKPLDMTGVVIRVSDSGSRTGFGIEFTRVNPAHKRLLSEYVKSQLK